MIGDEEIVKLHVFYLQELAKLIGEELFLGFLSGAATGVEKICLLHVFYLQGLAILNGEELYRQSVELEDFYLVFLSVAIDVENCFFCLQADELVTYFELIHDLNYLI